MAHNENMDPNPMGVLSEKFEATADGQLLTLDPTREERQPIRGRPPPLPRTRPRPLGWPTGDMSESELRGLGDELLEALEAQPELPPRPFLTERAAKLASSERAAAELAKGDRAGGGFGCLGRRPRRTARDPGRGIRDRRGQHRGGKRESWHPCRGGVVHLAQRGPLERRNQRLWYRLAHRRNTATGNSHWGVSFSDVRNGYRGTVLGNTDGPVNGGRNLGGTCATSPSAPELARTLPWTRRSSAAWSSEPVARRASRTGAPASARAFSSLRGPASGIASSRR